MFNAAASRAASDTEIEKISDDIAAEFEDRKRNLTTTEFKQLAKSLLELLGDENATKTFVAGTYAQAKASNGAPAQALGSSGSNPERDALQVLVNSPVILTGQKHALQRVLADPADARHLRVEADGTPSEIKTLKTEVANLTKDRDQANQDRDKAQKELADERDETKSGSLAAKAKAASGGAPAADFVKKSEVKGELEAAKSALSNPKDGVIRTSKVLKEADLNKAVAAIDKALGKVK